jgi:hypothetical protein
MPHSCPILPVRTFSTSSRARAARRRSRQPAECVRSEAGMPRQSWDASAGPLRRSVPRRAPPAALGPSGHGSVGAVRSQQTLWVAHVPETRLGPACRTGMASFPPPES